MHAGHSHAYIIGRAVTRIKFHVKILVKKKMCAYFIIWPFHGDKNKIDHPNILPSLSRHHSFLLIVYEPLYAGIHL